eukprot:SAG31_NODE_1347_length_8693_cov_32.744938_11_plen_279_part_00
MHYFHWVQDRAGGCVLAARIVSADSRLLNRAGLASRCSSQAQQVPRRLVARWPRAVPNSGASWLATSLPAAMSGGRDAPPSDVSGVWHVVGVGHERSAEAEPQTAAERIVLVQAADGTVTGHELPGEPDQYEMYGDVVEDTLALTQARAHHCMHIFSPEDLQHLLLVCQLTCWFHYFASVHSNQVYRHQSPAAEQRTSWVCTVDGERMVDGSWSGDFQGTFTAVRVEESVALRDWASTNAKDLSGEDTVAETHAEIRAIDDELREVLATALFCLESRS